MNNKNNKRMTSVRINNKLLQQAKEKHINISKALEEKLLYELNAVSPTEQQLAEQRRQQEKRLQIKYRNNAFKHWLMIFDYPFKVNEETAPYRLKYWQKATGIPADILEQLAEEQRYKKHLHQEMPLKKQEEIIISKKVVNSIIGEEYYKNLNEKYNELEEKRKKGEDNNERNKF